MLLDSAIRNAAAVGDAMVQQASMTVARSFSGLVGGLSSDPSPLEQLGNRQQTMQSSAEQLKHYRGQVYAVIRPIANRICERPLCMARVVSSQQQRGTLTMQQKAALPRTFKAIEDMAQPITDHPLLRAFRKPNDIMVQWSLIYLTVASIEMTGWAYWWLVQREDGRMQIWPLPSHWVTPKHGNDEDGLYVEWEVKIDGQAQTFTIPGKEVIHFNYPDPSNPMRAISPAQAMGDTIYADEAIDKAKGRSFSNGMNPGLALVVGKLPDQQGIGDDPPVLTVEQRNTIIRQAKKYYRGVVNWDEPLIIDGFIKDVKRITPLPRELDFLQSGKDTRDRLAQGWGVSPIIMGETENANRASSAVADEHFVRNVVQPRLELFSQTLTMRAAPLFARPGEELLIYFERATSQDVDFDLELEKSMSDRGAMSRDEWRLRHGMTEILEGKSAMTLSGVLVPVIPVPKPGQAVRGQAVADGWSTDIVRKLWMRKHAVVHAEMQAGFRATFSKFGMEIREKLKDMVRRGALPRPELVDAVFDEYGMTRDLMEAAKPLVLKGILLGAHMEWGLHHPAGDDDKGILDVILGLGDRVIDAAGNLLARIMSPDYWRQILGTFKDKIKRGFESVHATLEERPDLMGAQAEQIIEDVLATTAGETEAAAKAEAIADTEAPAAVNGGQNVARRELAALGFVTKKGWATQSDTLVRPTHVEAGKQEPVDADGYFVVGGFKAEYPGDPRLPASERCGCRCYSYSVKG